MITKSFTMITEAIFNDDGKERYLLRKKWSDEKSLAMIMIYPASDNIYELDLTTMKVLNNLHQLGYGSVDLLNICPKILPLSKEIGEIESEENNEQILKSCKSADNIVICWGSVGIGNKKISEKQIQILKLLEPMKEKILTTEDGLAKKCVHPLSPTLKRWKLVKFDFPQQAELKRNQGLEKAPKPKNQKKTNITLNPESNPTNQTTTKKIKEVV